MNEVQQMMGEGIITFEAVVHTTNQDKNLKKMKTRKPSYKGHAIMIALCCRETAHSIVMVNIL
jgi:hypothetical protein